MAIFHSQGSCFVGMPAPPASLRVVGALATVPGAVHGGNAPRPQFATSACLPHALRPARISILALTPAIPTLQPFRPSTPPPASSASSTHPFTTIAHAAAPLDRGHPRADAFAGVGRALPRKHARQAARRKGLQGCYEGELESTAFPPPTPSLPTHMYASRKSRKSTIDT